MIINRWVFTSNARNTKACHSSQTMVRLVSSNLDRSSSSFINVIILLNRTPTYRNLPQMAAQKPKFQSNLDPHWKLQPLSRSSEESSIDYAATRPQDHSPHQSTTIVPLVEVRARDPELLKTRPGGQCPAHIRAQLQTTEGIMASTGKHQRLSQKTKQDRRQARPVTTDTSYRFTRPKEIKKKAECPLFLDPTFSSPPKPTHPAMTTRISNAESTTNVNHHPESSLDHRLCTHRVTSFGREVIIKAPLLKK